MLRDLLLVLVNLNSWEVDLDADYVVNLCLVKKIKGAFCPHFTACSKLARKTCRNQNGLKFDKSNYFKGTFKPTQHHEFCGSEAPSGGA